MIPNVVSTNSVVNIISFILLHFQVLHFISPLSKMWQLLLITGLLGLADANSYAPVDPVTLAGFTNQFRQMIMHLIGAEFKTTDALVQQLKIAMTTCKIAIGTQRGQCKSCAKDSCKPSVNDKIMHFMNLVAKPFVSVGNDIGTWKGWQDMVDWFQGAGQEFVNWGAWDDIEGFFKDIGNYLLMFLIILPDTQPTRSIGPPSAHLRDAI